MMDGILLINKPVGITSRDVVNMVSKKFNTKKIGHTGTLDPFADGLLVLTIGKGTKCSQFLEEKVKTYVATLFLGKSTDTLDKDGVVVEEKEVKQYSIEDITSVLESFKGEITQAVPLYSAIRVNGKKLYEYARNGIQVELPSRQINIFDIKLLHYEGNIIRFEVTCSKGTYIRVLGNDIAHKLGTLGHLISLTRKKVGSFLLENSKKVEDITSDDIINIYDALKDNIETLHVNDRLAEDIKNGKHLPFETKIDRLFVCSEKNEPIAIIERDHGKIFKVVRGLF